MTIKDTPEYKLADSGEKRRMVMRERYGADYFARIGRKGGKAQVPKGFARMPKEKVSEAGRKGGSRSRRGDK